MCSCRVQLVRAPWLRAVGRSGGEETELIGKARRFQANAVELMRLSFETKCPQPVARERGNAHYSTNSCEIDDSLEAAKDLSLFRGEMFRKQNVKVFIKTINSPRDKRELISF